MESHSSARPARRGQSSPAPKKKSVIEGVKPRKRCTGADCRKEGCLRVRVGAVWIGSFLGFLLLQEPGVRVDGAKKMGGHFGVSFLSRRQIKEE